MKESKYPIKKVIHKILIITALFPATILMLLCVLGTIMLLSELGTLSLSELVLFLAILLGFPGYTGLIFIALGREKIQPVLTACLLGCGLTSVTLLIFSLDLWKNPLFLPDMEYTIMFLWPFAVGLYFFFLTLRNIQLKRNEDDESILDQE